MPPLIKVGDQETLVDTKDFPLAKFPFPKFNPVQSRVFEFYDKDANAIIAAATSAGKTVMAEMLAAYQIRIKKKKVIYLAPMKSLAKEKYDDWTDSRHHFGDLNVSICTGDYRLTPERKKELEAADIIILTNEMLSSRTRNMTSEKNEWLKQVGLVVADESHLLGVPGRGDHAEIGMMSFTKLNPEARLVLLSATIPNVDQIAEWVSYSLTKRETYLLVSKYRPCPLGVHYETYDTVGGYDQVEKNKIDVALEILEEHPDDKFLLFVHTKRTGEMLKTAVKAKFKKHVEFHSADLGKADREDLEARFKSREADSLQYLVATSTLAWGCNMPARRVIILGVHRGMGEVETYDIVQMQGRAGRVGFDPRGDVYILLPENREEFHRNRLRNQANIESRLLENLNGHYKTLAFHLVSEIHHGRIKTIEDIHEWYSRTLACFQSQDLDDTIVKSTLDLLMRFGAVKEDDGIYRVTVVGMVASMFYYSPFDVADLRKNFMNLFKNNQEDDDVSIALALGNVDSVRLGIVSRSEREDMGLFGAKVKKQFVLESANFNDAAIKGAFAYFCAMTGGNPGSVGAYAKTLQWDAPRLIQVLQGLDTLGCKWNKVEYFKDLQNRIFYGVAAHLIDFVKLPDIGKVRAERLYSVGFRNISDIVADPEKVRVALNMKAEKVLDIVTAAKGLMLMGSS